MIQRTVKIWSAIGAFAVTGAAVAATPPVNTADEFPNGTLDKALDKVFAGEGGEGGLGFTKMTRSFSVPALSENQLRAVFTGNTLGLPRKIAAFLRSDGKIEGWYAINTPVTPVERCANQDFNATYLYMTHAGQCMHRSFAQFKTETWSIKGDQICLPESVGLGTGCYNAALVLNNVVLFDEGGNMVNKGRELAKGKVVPAMPVNKPLKSK